GCHDFRVDGSRWPLHKVAQSCINMQTLSSDYSGAEVAGRFAPQAGRLHNAVSTIPPARYGGSYESPSFVARFSRVARRRFRPESQGHGWRLEGSAHLIINESVRADE